MAQENVATRRPPPGLGDGVVVDEQDLHHADEHLERHPGSQSGRVRALLGSPWRRCALRDRPGRAGSALPPGSGDRTSAATRPGVELRRNDPACRVETTTTRVELRRTTRPAGSGLWPDAVPRERPARPRGVLRGRSDRPSRATRQPRSGSSFARTTRLAGLRSPQLRCQLRPARTGGREAQSGVSIVKPPNRGSS